MRILLRRQLTAELWWCELWTEGKWEWSEWGSLCVLLAWLPRVCFRPLFSQTQCDSPTGNPIRWGHVSLTCHTHVSGVLTAPVQTPYICKPGSGKSDQQWSCACNCNNCIIILTSMIQRYGCPIPSSMPVPVSLQFSSPEYLYTSYSTWHGKFWVQCTLHPGQISVSVNVLSILCMCNYYGLCRA